MAIGFGISIIIISAILAILVVRKREVRGETSLIVFSVALTIWACSYAALQYDKLSGGRFWLALFYLSATVTASALLTFILAYTNHPEWLGKLGIFILCLEPVVTQVLFWTNRFSSDSKLATSRTVLSSSPWYWINASYSDGLIILGLILLTDTLRHNTKQYRTPVPDDLH